MRDRGFNRELIERRSPHSARRSCSRSICRLGRAPAGSAQRPDDSAAPLAAKCLGVASEARLGHKVLFGKRRTFGNLVGRIGGKTGVRTLAEWTHANFDASANWRDVEWVRSRWPGRLILKGVLDAEDARFALAAGADAVVVSNHGGRQLDGAPSSISVLPEIVAAIDGRCEVLFDGGIRSGQDVAKASPWVRARA